jgi:hypothetical protein
LARAADRRSFVITPPRHRQAFARLLPDSWELELQASGDLGQRIEAWFSGGGLAFSGTPPAPAAPAPAPGAEDRLLIGADCPLIGPQDIRRAGRLLHDHDLVLGPAIDGGYYLIGLRGGWQPRYTSLLSGIPWSTARVFELTCRRAEAAGLRLATLEPREDIDSVVELRHLLAQLRSPTSAPAHRDLLESIARLELALDDRTVSRFPEETQ